MVGYHLWLLLPMVTAHRRKPLGDQARGRTHWYSGGRWIAEVKDLPHNWGSVATTFRFFCEGLLLGARSIH